LRVLAGLASEHLNFQELEKEMALRRIAESIMGFFTSLGCAALLADGELLRSGPPECCYDSLDQEEAA
jgi:hypothetical protein